MPGLPICILRDLTLPVLAYSPHNYGPLPAGPPVPAVTMSPAPASAIDVPAPMLHPPGNMTGKNKYSMTVIHQGLGIIQAGHDLGMMLSHVQVTPAPNNFFTPMHILFSSRKVVFSSSTVKIDKQFVGFAGLIGLPPTPMLVCAEPIGYPMGEVPTRWLNNVWVGMEWSDWGLGLGTIAASMLLDRALAPAKDKAAGKLKDAMAEGLKKQVVKKLFPQTKDEAKKIAKKQAVALAQGVVTMLAKGGDGEAGATLGSDYANVSLKFKRDGDKKLSVSVKGSVPALSQTFGAEEGKGVFSKSDANWGGGAGSYEVSPKGSKTVTHDAFAGTAATESSK